jgi:hypothetical protein
LPAVPAREAGLVAVAVEPCELPVAMKALWMAPEDADLATRLFPEVVVLPAFIAAAPEPLGICSVGAATMVSPLLPTLAPSSAPGRLLTDWKRSTPARCALAKSRRPKKAFMSS